MRGTKFSVRDQYFRGGSIGPIRRPHPDARNSRFPVHHPLRLEKRCGGRLMRLLLCDLCAHPLDLGLESRDARFEFADRKRCERISNGGGGLLGGWLIPSPCRPRRRLCLLVRLCRKLRLLPL